MEHIVPSVLQFVPAGKFVEAHMQILSPDMITHGITGGWWRDSALKSHFDSPPIDLHWDWSEIEIIYEGKLLASETVGVITDDGEIQGAMLVSSEPIKSALVESEDVLFVEMLFTAPRNRSMLRKDGKKYYGGVGPELLRWAALFSRERGYRGRLKLDASPDYLTWYIGLGFEKLDIEPVMFEDVEYTPLELPFSAVERVLATPKGPRKGPR